MAQLWACLLALALLPAARALPRAAAAPITAPPERDTYDLVLPPLREPAMRVMQRMLQRTADCNVTHLLLSFNWTRPAFPVTVHTCGDGTVSNTVVTAIDAKGVMHLPVMINSLYEHNRQLRLNVDVLALLADPSDPVLTDICTLKQQLWPDFRLSFHIMQPERLNTYFSYSHDTKGVLKHVSAATMARLLMAELLLDAGVVAYLDLDVLVMGSIADMFNGRACSAPVPTAAFPVVVVANHGSAHTDDLCAKSSLRDNMGGWLTPDTRCVLGIKDKTRQFNAGVLVLDLARMRAWGFPAFAVFVSRVFGVNDQVVLNLYSGPRYGELLGTYNVYANKDESLYNRSDWRVAHSAGSKKAWELMTPTAWSPMWLARTLPGYLLVWSSFTQPIPASAVERVREQAAVAGLRPVTLVCASQQCTDACIALQALPGPGFIRCERLRIAWFTGEDHPLGEWFRKHGLIKLWTGANYPTYFHFFARLASLHRHGGVLLDWDTRLVSNLLLPAAGESWCYAPGGGGAGAGGWAASFSAGSPALAADLARLVATFPSYEYQGPWPLVWQPGEWTRACPFKGAGEPPQGIEQYISSSPSAEQQPLEPQPPPAKDAPRFGVLWYDERARYLAKGGNPGVNLGDEVQGVAALQWLPYVTERIERDDLLANASYAQGQGQGQEGKGDVTLFMNAWYGTLNMAWPPARGINPVMISMHVEPQLYPLFTSPASLDYLRAHAPVGARDSATQELLLNHGVVALLSRCLTLTMQRQRRPGPPQCDVLVVDVDKRSRALQALPKGLRVCYRSPKYLDGGSGARFDGVLRYTMAYELLQDYGSARVVVTSRLHSAMPAASMGVPVLLMLTEHMPGGGGGKDGQQRFSGLQELVHYIDWQDTEADPAAAMAAFNWTDPPPNPGADELEDIRCAIFDHLLRRHPELRDPLHVFDAGDMMQPCKFNMTAIALNSTQPSSKAGVAALADAVERAAEAVAAGTAPTAAAAAGRRTTISR